MSAPVIDPTASTEGIPENAVPIRLPVMVIEGMETSDHRYIEPGTLTTRTLPIPLYAATRSTHGADGDAATWHVGAITHAERVPGPQVVDMDGNALPEGTFAWQGTGWMYTDVPAAPAKSAYQLVKDKALRGNSVDMTEVVAEYQDAAGQLADEGTYVRISMQSGVIAATTLVGIPAFAGAYIELDGQAMAAAEHADTLTAAAWPSWRSLDLGDECSPCAAGDDDIVGELRALAAAIGDDFDPPENDYSTSGMVALIPANPNMLLVPGGDPAEELHLTLAYLGDEVDTWGPEQVSAVHRIALETTDQAAMIERYRREATERGDKTPDPASDYGRSPAQEGPLDASIFAHAVFNPADNPATVYLLDGGGQREAIEWLHNDIVGALRNALGNTILPEQHSPFVPHVTAGYGVPVDQLTYTGPITFDRLRVAIGDDVVDYPLGGGDVALVASVESLPPASIFTNPNLPGPTPHTVEETGAPWGDIVYGHLAAWETCHTGMAGRCVTPPRSATGYAYFMVHATRAQDADGNPVTVPVGYGTISRGPGQGGHAGLSLSAQETAAHYDNTCTAAFEIAVGEDDYGIWYAGRLLPGLDEQTRHKAFGAVFSGDWRPVRGNRELMAALAVNTPGFPVVRALVASGQPGALVAAGAVPQRETAPEEPVSETAELLAWVREQKLAATRAARVEELEHLLAGVELVGAADRLAEAEVELLLQLDGDHPWFADGAQVAGWEGSVGPLTEGGYVEPHVYARDVHSGAGNCVCGSALGDQLHVQAAPGVPVPDSMRAALTAAGRKVLHLPPYIKRISKHLREKGMAQGRAIATAVNAAKKMCATGDLNFPGSQQVNPGSRAEACAAVAQWKKDRPGAR